MLLLTLPLYAESSDEETPLAEEAPLAGEPLLEGEDSPLVGESLPEGEDSPLAEEPLLEGEDSPLAEEPLPEGGFFFEAPPLIFEVPPFRLRSFDAIFPNLSWIDRILALSSEGLKYSFGKDESPTIIPNPDLEINLLDRVLKKNPSHLIEALAVVPYNARELDLLDIYNALGRIEKLKDYAASFNGNYYHIFTESTRIESARNRRVVPDPPPAVTLPFSDTMFLRLREFSFGNLFIRIDISISTYGITYSMTNFLDVRYFILPIMRAERFTTILYLEPIKEGVLIYCMSGFYLPGFIADRINLTPNINRRIEVFINWITDGLREQE
jgi:hypothetical protein